MNVMIWLSTAFATTMLGADLSTLAEKSDAIVVATVGSSQPIEVPRVLAKETQLRVDHVVRGEAPSRLALRQIGGIHGDQTSRIAGDARLTEGERVVLCLAENNGVWTLTALAQGVWYVEGVGKNAGVRRDVAGLDLLEMGPPRRPAAGLVFRGDSRHP